VKLLNISIVPSLPGFQTVYEMPEGPELLGHVIAWRISTYETVEGGETVIRSESTPLGADGEPGANWIGVRGPDGSVTLSDATVWESWEKYSKARSK
jgi:hypothetical protein